MDDRKSNFQELSDIAGIIVVALTFVTWSIAFLFGVGRMAVYSTTGEYVLSLCQTAAYVSKFDSLTCIIHTRSFAFNKIATWLLLASDASVAIVLIGVALSAISFALGLVFMTAARISVRRDQ